MKQKFPLLTIISILALMNTNAQNTFPSVGNAGAGTTTPATTFQVIGHTRMGGTVNYAQFANNGSLSFKGNSNYSVEDNKYIFNWSGNANLGLYMNSTNKRFEFKDESGTSFFYLDAFNKGAVLQAGIRIGSSNNTIAGTIRWTGVDYEGYDGSGWRSFTTTTAGANLALSNLTSTAINVNLLPDVDNTRDLGYTTKSWRNAYIDGAYYLQGYKFINSKDQNVFVGRSTGAGISTGVNNTFTGSQSGVKTTTGSDNSFFGYSAGNANISGTSNTFIGKNAGVQNTTGGQNTVLGAFSGSGAGNGSFNLFMGYQTGSLTGSHNIGLGNNAGLLNQGDANIFIGGVAGYFNKADNNIFIGSSSGYKNTFGNSNVFIGRNTGAENLLGGNNTFLGDETGKLNDNGGNNTFLGKSAGYYNTDGTGNTFVGHLAGYNNDFGDNNTFIGLGAGGSSNWNNSIAIGFDAETTASNQVRIGNSIITSIGGFAGWTKVSDGRFKKNVKENIPGLAFINKLRPVSYNLDHGKIKSILGKKDNANEDASAIAAMEKIVHTGFIAQEVDEAAKNTGYDFDGVDAPKNESDYYGLRYAEFVVPLVKAVQELSKENETLKMANIDLEKRLEKIEKMLVVNNNNATAITDKATIPFTLNQKNIQLSSAKLEQNIPNPASNSTVIKYFIPNKSSNAMVKIYSAVGIEIKSITLTSKGNGQLNLQTGLLTAGTYSYTLLVDGKMVESKKMMIIK